MPRRRRRPAAVYPDRGRGHALRPARNPYLSGGREAARSPADLAKTKPWKDKSFQGFHLFCSVFMTAARFVGIIRIFRNGFQQTRLRERPIPKYPPCGHVPPQAINTKATPVPTKYPLTLPVGRAIFKESVDEDALRFWFFQRVPGCWNGTKPSVRATASERAPDPPPAG